MNRISKTRWIMIGNAAAAVMFTALGWVSDDHHNFSVYVNFMFAGMNIAMFFVSLKMVDIFTRTDELLVMKARMDDKEAQLNKMAEMATQWLKDHGITPPSEDREHDKRLN